MNKYECFGELHIPKGWAVVGQDNQLGFSLTDHLLGLFVAQDVFSTLHHQLETGVDGLHGLFLNAQKVHILKQSISKATQTKVTKLGYTIVVLTK